MVKVPAPTLALVVALLAASPALAARFGNQYVEFELPPQWQCTLESSEWICQNTFEAKKKDAIIVMAAKLKGDRDSLDQYLEYLKGPKAYTTAKGQAMKSDPKYAKTVNVNGQPWVDALHLESEIPGFYTRYLATVKQDIGVLLTYSIAKSKYQEYAPDFDTLVKTLRVFRKAGGINGGGDNRGSAFPNPIATDNPGLMIPTEGGNNNASARKGADGELPVIPLIVGGAAVVFFILRRRRRG